MKIERECKIRVTDPAATVARLRALGADDQGLRFERNWVFDTDDQRLYGTDMLLRLRTEDDGEAGILTVKKPALNAVFKNREEIEIGVESASGARTLLEALGYTVKWYYEKHRTYWRYRGCIVTVDELPQIGSFVEVEGPAEHAIRLVLSDLGLDPQDHIPENYLALFAHHCQAHGEPLHEMRFETAAKD